MNQKLLAQFLAIPGWLSENEGLLLYELARKAGNKSTLVEIGSFCGRSTCFLAQGLKEAGGVTRVFAIDPHQGQTHTKHTEHVNDTVVSLTCQNTLAKLQKNLRRFSLISQVKVINRTSSAASKNWRRPISLLFIDGLHEYQYAKQDLQIWLPYLTDGGVVVCHDAFLASPDVWQAVREEIFARHDSWRGIGALDSLIFAVKGKPRNIFEQLNLDRSRFFLTAASSLWHYSVLPKTLRFFIVNRLLKLFFLNRYMLAAILKKVDYLKLKRIIKP